MPVEEIGHRLFLVLIWYSLAGVIWIPLVWGALTFLTPKSLLDRYFKTPHFNSFELAFFRNYPGSFLRTAMFSWILFFPKPAQRGRKIFDAHLYMPTWYQISLRVMLIAVCFSMIFVLALMLILFVLPGYGDQRIY